MELPELLLALDEVESLEREEVEERLMLVSMEGIEFSVFIWLSVWTASHFNTSTCSK